MTHVSIKEAKTQLTALARRVEAGERIVVTRHGKPAFDMVPHEPKTGLDWEAGRRYLDSLGVDQIITWVSPDFDDPLPEDFLITPLPEYALPRPPLDDGTVAPPVAPSAHERASRVSVLLDTNILIPIIRKEADTLDRSVRALIDRQRTSLFSVASLWEIAIKFRLGKLELSTLPATIPGLLGEIGLSMLDVTADHALVEIDPAPATRDPLDRLLLGVCAAEGMRLVTTDRALQGHPLAWREG